MGVPWLPGYVSLIVLYAVVATGKSCLANVETKPKGTMDHGLHLPRAGTYLTSITSYTFFVRASRGGEGEQDIGGGVCLPGRTGVAGASSGLSIIPSTLETCPAVGESYTVVALCVGRMILTTS